MTLDEYRWWEFDCLWPQSSLEDELGLQVTPQPNEDELGLQVTPQPNVNINSETQESDSIELTPIENCLSISQRIRTLRRNTNSKYRRDKPDA